ncbi:MAG: DUF4157 domain-containing protein [Actinomycetota bacterium]|nr:DUF4157 domain-containing protein [Actinomycetota bacterium]
MTAGQSVRMVANLLNLSTPLGVLLAAVTRTPLARGPAGLILGTGYRPRLPVAAAFTVGNVVIYRAGRDCIDARPALLAHEARHSTQYACCLGLPFLPLYGLCALWSLWRSGDPGSRNPFERQAGLEAGGYRERATVQRFGRLRAARTSEVPQ